MSATPATPVNELDILGQRDLQRELENHKKRIEQCEEIMGLKDYMLCMGIPEEEEIDALADSQVEELVFEEYKMSDLKTKFKEQLKL
jgi:hypothetical protein